MLTEFLEKTLSLSSDEFIQRFGVAFEAMTLEQMQAAIRELRAQRGCGYIEIEHDHGEAA